MIPSGRSALQGIAVQCPSYTHTTAHVKRHSGHSVCNSALYDRCIARVLPRNLYLKMDILYLDSKSGKKVRNIFIILLNETINDNVVKFDPYNMDYILYLSKTGWFGYCNDLVN